MHPARTCGTRSRKKVARHRGNLPPGVDGPFFNDEFGDTYGIIYAFTADGFSAARAEDHAERVRDELLQLPDVGKVDLLGAQDEKIHHRVLDQQLAEPGHRPRQIAARRSQPAERRRLPPARSDRQRSVCCAVSGEFAVGGRSARDQLRAPTTASSGSATSPPSRAAMSTRRTQCFASTASRRIGLAISMQPRAATSSALGADLSAAVAELAGRHCRSASMRIWSPTSRSWSRSGRRLHQDAVEAVVIVLA